MDIGPDVGSMSLGLPEILTVAHTGLIGSLKNQGPSISTQKLGSRTEGAQNRTNL